MTVPPPTMPWLPSVSPQSGGEQVGVRVASSFVSADQAFENLKELGDADFDRLRQQGRDRWNDVLGRIEVSDANTDHLRTLYSNLYRCVLFPRMFFEVNAQGDTIHYSPYNGKVLPGAMFTDTGFRDTFRALMPLVDPVYPSMGRLMQEGLVNAYKESGFLPEWASPGHRDCMVGNNSASVVADAYLKGLRGYDAETLGRLSSMAPTPTIPLSAARDEWVSNTTTVSAMCPTM